MAESGDLTRFLAAVHLVHATGAALPETSYYPAISQLLGSVGGRLRPKVRPVIHISGGEAGIADGGLFLDKPAGPITTSGTPMLTGSPERGAIEVKPPDRDLAQTARTAQVRKYLDRYGKVLLTSMREWALIVADPGTGRARTIDKFRLTADAPSFWELAARETRPDSGTEADFVEFLERALTHDAPLSSPKDLAWVLAAYARTALSRIEGKESKPLEALRDALRGALGITFEGAKGERFFRTTLVQTLFYGVFSSWVLWHQEGQPEGERFRWKDAAWHLRVPMVSVLFERIATPSTLRTLGVEELMDATEDVLARVDRERFFERFEADRAVQYFYEPFLEHYDATLRAEFGVWYTPPEVVHYMVERVHQTLREDFGLPDGLADERVYVLDPCVGTGSFLTAVLDRIRATLPDDGLAAQDVKTAAMGRVFGFEILPAPFVVAHLQLGLKLAGLGAPLDPGSDERAAVYLTNALTGWTDEQIPALPFPELEEERDAARSVKRSSPILVVMGNPPYYQYSGLNSEEEVGLIGPYKAGITTKHSLNDLYVRFFRVAERRIVDGLGHGVVCLITNFSYLHEPGFVQMRNSLLGSFDEISIDCLNGDSRETGKRTPDGKPDPSIFRSNFNPQGIQVGTAIGLCVRREADDHDQPAVVRYRDFWGEDKKAALAELTGSPNQTTGYVEVPLSDVNRQAFRPSVFSDAYETWPPVTDLAAQPPTLGLNENRGSVLIDPDPAEIERRMRGYLDPTKTTQDLQQTASAPLVRSWARFDPEATRSAMLAGGGYDPSKLRRFLSRPLDVQWAYVDTTRKLWNEVRAKEVFLHAFDGN